MMIDGNAFLATLATEINDYKEAIERAGGIRNNRKQADRKVINYQVKIDALLDVQAMALRYAV